MICAWGIDKDGHRQLVSVRLGARESKEDWVELGRDLMARGLAAPRLVVADGAPGLIGAVEEIWPRADRQHCAVHRLRNLPAKLPKAERDRIRFNYWSVLLRLGRARGEAPATPESSSRNRSRGQPSTAPSCGRPSMLITPLSSVMSWTCWCSSASSFA